ncbi:MAG: hypothetical protein QOI45_1540, partial [Thermoleophilaceae bacterium]|nr:hypothetical protein [Thermoleophilaceae bacterium]
MHGIVSAVKARVLVLPTVLLASLAATPALAQTPPPAPPAPPPPAPAPAAGKATY